MPKEDFQTALRQYADKLQQRINQLQTLVPSLDAVEHAQNVDELHDKGIHYAKIQQELDNILADKKTIDNIIDRALVNPGINEQFKPTLQAIKQQLDYFKYLQTRLQQLRALAQQEEQAARTNNTDNLQRAIQQEQQIKHTLNTELARTNPKTKGKNVLRSIVLVISAFSALVTTACSAVQPQQKQPLQAAVEAEPKTFEAFFKEIKPAYMNLWGFETVPEHIEQWIRHDAKTYFDANYTVEQTKHILALERGMHAVFGMKTRWDANFTISYFNALSNDELNDPTFAKALAFARALHAQGLDEKDVLMVKTAELSPSRDFAERAGFFKQLGLERRQISRALNACAAEPFERVKTLATQAKKILNMKHFYRFHLNDLEQLIANAKQGTSPAVMFLARADWNDGFATTAAADLYHNILAIYPNLICKEITKEQEMYNLVQELGKTNKLTLLILAGHGSKISISFGDKDPRLWRPEKTEQYTLGLEDRQDLVDYALHQYLAENAIIWNLSCSTAKGGKDAENIAHMLADTLRAKVYASKNPISLASMKITAENGRITSITIKDDANTVIFK